jgi:NB-ARC domain
MMAGIWGRLAGLLPSWPRATRGRERLGISGAGDTTPLPDMPTAARADGMPSLREGKSQITISGSATVQKLANIRTVVGNVYLNSDSEGDGQRKSTQQRPFQAPGLPPHYVERVALVAELVNKLTAGGGAPRSVVTISALQGQGGIGKTTLAAAVAHSPKIREKFVHGVFWATLGQEPQVNSLLTGSSNRGGAGSVLVGGGSK